jgi:hypothetical protein
VFYDPPMNPPMVKPVTLVTIVTLVTLATLVTPTHSLIAGIATQKSEWGNACNECNTHGFGWKDGHGGDPRGCRFYRALGAAFTFCDLFSFVLDDLQ